LLRKGAHAAATLAVSHIEQNKRNTVRGAFVLALIRRIMTPAICKPLGKTRANRNAGASKIDDFWHVTPEFRDDASKMFPPQASALAGISW
jgi:hypothetical protein